MKKFLVLIFLLLTSVVSFGQIPALAPVSTPTASWRIRSIVFNRNPSASIFISLYNYTDSTGTQTRTVSYPCETSDCATDTDAEVQTLIDTWFSGDYTGTGLEETMLTQAVADFDSLAGLTCCD